MKLRNICLYFLLASAQLAAADQDSAQLWKAWVTRADALHRQGQFDEAAAVGKRALTLARSFGRTDLRLPTSYYLLGSVYREWGHCAESRANLAHAVALYEKHLDEKPPFAFNAVVSLVSEASECEDYVGAQKLYRIHADALHRFADGPLDDAELLAIQGGVARGRKHYAEAEDYFRRAIQLLEQTPGSKPTDIAEIRSSMAVMMGLQGRHQESLAETQRSIAVFESISPRSFNLPAVLNNAACTLATLGRKEEADRVYHRALDLARDLFGEDNRNTARIMLNYAALLQDKKEMPAALALKKQGTEAYRRSLMRDTQTVDVEQLSAK